MMTKTAVKVQVSRLVALPAKDNSLFGVEPQAIRDELGRALERFATTDEEAQRAVDWLIFNRPAEERIFRPTPGEIPDSVTRIRELTEKESQSPDGCEECQGQPWVTIEKLVKDSHTDGPMLRSGSRRCFCAKGQWFRQKDRERLMESKR